MAASICKKLIKYSIEAHHNTIHYMQTQILPHFDFGEFAIIDEKNHFNFI